MTTGHVCSVYKNKKTGGFTTYSSRAGVATPGPGFAGIDQG